MAEKFRTLQGGPGQVQDEHCANEVRHCCDIFGVRTQNLDWQVHPQYYINEEGGDPRRGTEGT